MGGVEWLDISYTLVDTVFIIAVPGCCCCRFLLPKRADDRFIKLLRTPGRFSSAAGGGASSCASGGPSCACELRRDSDCRMYDATDVRCGVDGGASASCVE